MFHVCKCAPDIMIFQDPDKELKELYPLLLQGMHQNPCSQPLYGYCGDLRPVRCRPLLIMPALALVAVLIPWAHGVCAPPGTGEEGTGDDARLQRARPRDRAVRLCAFYRPFP